MFEIVFLGTSATAPSIQRNLCAQAILAGDKRFLLDCGEGTQRQILRSGIGFKRLDRILLTHAHLDHILGLAGLVSTLASWEGVEKLEIYGGRHALNRVERLLFGVVLPAERTTIDIRLIDIDAGVIWENPKFQILAFATRHRGRGNFGYVFQQREQRPFLVERAEALGIPAGPERRQLVLGESITLADGREIMPDEVLGEAVAGVKIVFGGDGQSDAGLRRAARDADLLVSEATFMESEAEEARRFGHTTARRAALLAREARCRNLILTHISRRYSPAELLAEAREVFPAAQLARDFDHYVIRSGGELYLKKGGNLRRIQAAEFREDGQKKPQTCGDQTTDIAVDG